MTTNQPNKRLFSGTAGTLALTARRATTLTVTRAAMLLLVMMLTATTAAWATSISTINVGGTDYALYTGFTATAGTESYANFVDGNTSTQWQVMKNWDNPNAPVNDFAGGPEDPALVEFHADAPVIPKGYVLTYDNSVNENWKPTSWALKAKLNENDDWTEIHSSNSPLGNGSHFEIACTNDGNNQYQYFRFEIYDVGTTMQSILNELQFYGFEALTYTHLTVTPATCTATGIKQECWKRSDGKYFTDNTGTTELAESDVIAPIIPHTGEHHEATDVNIEYWQCSMCGKYFSDEGCTTEITEEQTKIYRTITIDNSISGLVTSNVNQALAGATVTLTVSHLIDASTLKVNNGAVELTDIGSNQYTFTVPADNVTVTAETLSTYSFSLPDNMEIVSTSKVADSDGKYITGTTVTFKPMFGYEASNVSDGTSTLEPDANGIYTVTVADADITITATVKKAAEPNKTLSGSESYTAQDGDVLTGSTSGTVTIAGNANITLNNATISGGIVCNGTATITLVGTNSVTGASQKAGIQIGGSSTTLTIRGNGSLTANGQQNSAGIGLSRAWDPDGNVIGGDIVIEGGNITANGGSQWGAGIGTGVIYGNGSAKTVRIGNITIKGGTVKATGGSDSDGIGTGYTYFGCTNAIGTVTIYDGINMVDASSISESIVYMHETTDVTESKADYFTIGEDGNRRIIVQKVTPTIADVPDQTYTGSAITPEPTVIAGSLSLTKGTDYVYSYTNNTNVGTAKVRATFQGTYASLGYVEKEFTIVYPTVTTSYVDASGTLHENVEAIPLDNTMTTLPAGTYVVNSDVAYTGTVTLSGDVTLILGDGCTMSFGTEGELLNGTIIECNFNNLTIYGQSGGTGWLKAYSAQYDGINHVNYYTQYSGNVVISDGNGACIDAREFTILGGTLDLKSEGGANGEIIVTTENINIRGGKLWARSKGLKTMNGKIILDYTNATDQIYVKAYNPQNGLQIADGKTLVDDNGEIWSGALNNNQIKHGINNRTLKPVMGVTLTKDGSGNISAEFDGTSTTTMSIPVNVNVTSVTYNRTFTEGKPSTVMLPFSMDVSNISGTNFYTFGGVTKTADKWIATMNQVTGTLAANTPYLVEPTATTLTFTGGATLNTTGGGNCLASDTEGWEFHGVYQKTEWNAASNDYGFAATNGTSADGEQWIEAGQFVRLTSGAWMKPMRCYLHYEPEPASSRRMSRAASTEELPQSITVRLVSANGDTDDIGTISIDNGQLTIDNCVEGEWYSLDGKILSGKPTKKGLYINNGRTVVIE